jgi:bifunctional non-homologous end joining protein LigD
VAAEETIRRGRRRLRLTHLDRVFWPEEGLTKGDLLDYYREVAPVLLPHLRNRPFTIKRHFTVPRGPFEWVKDAPPELPEWVKTCPQPARSRGGASVHYPLVNDELSLLAVVEYGAVDLHVWPSRCDRPERPDYVIFDLDPSGGAGVAEAARAALLVRGATRAMGLDSVVRTSGAAGLHVLVPIERRHRHDEARAFARVVAAALARTSPDLVTLERVKARRRGVYVDAKMNGHGQQFVASYSVRPLPGAPVAAPLRWEELTADLDPGEFTIDVVLDRVHEYGDLHERLLRGRQRLDRALGRVSS